MLTKYWERNSAERGETGGRFKFPYKFYHIIQHRGADAVVRLLLLFPSNGFMFEWKLSISFASNIYVECR